MDDKNISYIAYESALYHTNKANKRMFVICVILAVALIFSNLGWILYERQFETVEESVTETSRTTTSYDVEQSGDGDTQNIIGNSGDVTYGETTN